jgi:hypothetical protein
MANVVYPTGMKAFADADIDFLVDDIKIAAMSSTYVYSAAHDFRDDLTGVVASSANLSSKTSTGGVLDAADPVFTSVTGSTIVSFAMFKDTGTASTSRLICFWNATAAGAAFAVVPDGTNITLTLSASGLVAI